MDKSMMGFPPRPGSLRPTNPPPITPSNQYKKINLEGSVPRRRFLRMLAPPDPNPDEKHTILAQRTTSLVIWFAAAVCAALAVVVIITGLVVLSIYLAYRPKMPYVRVRDTHLDDLRFDTSGQLGVRITMNMEADNDNTKADASFSDIGFELRFAQVPVAQLRADPFDVIENSSFLLPYVVESSAVPLDPPRMEKMDQALKQGKVEFSLSGQARTRWRVGVFLSVRFWTHLDCNLQYFYPNGSSIDLDCTSKSH